MRFRNFAQYEKTHRQRKNNRSETEPDRRAVLLFFFVILVTLSGCSRRYATVTTRDGTTTRLASLALCEYGFFADYSSGSFTLHVPNGTLKVPRSLEGIRELEILQTGVTALQYREKLRSLRAKKLSTGHKPDAKEKIERIEAEESRLHLFYRLRITYKNGSAVEGNVTDFLTGWGYITGTTENGEMKIPLDRIASIKLD